MNTTKSPQPVIRLGTIDSDHYPAESIAEAVKGAIEIGYLQIDCATVYGNDRLVGQSLQHAMQIEHNLWMRSSRTM